MSTPRQALLALLSALFQCEVFSLNLLGEQTRPLIMQTHGVLQASLESDTPQIRAALAQLAAAAAPGANALLQRRVQEAQAVLTETAARVRPERTNEDQVGPGQPQEAWWQAPTFTGHTDDAGNPLFSDGDAPEG